MTLGEKIAKMRNDNRMSQGDLAEKINVSRQSVSKWETGASIPELDKLIMLSRLFQISIDELVKDEIPEPDHQAADITAQEQKANPGQGLRIQKTTGMILLAVALLTGVLSLMLAPAFIVLALYILLCGILCLTVKKYVGLIIGWITIVPLILFLPYFTGTQMGAIFNPYLYQNKMYIQLALVFVVWAAMIALIYFTLRLTFLRRQMLLVIGWIILSQMRGFIPIVFGIVPYRGKIYFALSLLSIFLLVILIIFTAKALFGCLKAHRRKNGHNEEQ